LSTEHKTKYHIKAADKSSENVANMDGFGMEATNQNYTNGEVTSEVN
jgi:hypothetical protein